MIRLYADEQFPFPVVQRLRQLGYDVLTAQESGQANQKIPDDQVLSFATANKRAVITQNRRDFIRLHQQGQTHAGIVVCAKNLDWDAFAAAIHQGVSGSGDSCRRIDTHYQSLNPPLALAVGVLVQ